MSVFAFARGCAVGIDVEGIRDVEDLAGIAQNYFCAEEAAELLSLSTEERIDAFFRCWTCKEAYTKAIGEGLHVPLDRFRVALRQDEPARFVQIGGNASTAAAWMLHSIPLEYPFVSFLAFPAPPRALSTYPTLNAAELLG